MKKFCVITNSYKDKECKLANKIKEYIESRDGLCCVLDNVEPISGNFRIIEQKEVDADTQCIITIGGDGTLLHAAKDLMALDVVFVGVNKGTLGFLAEIPQNHMEKSLDKLLNDNFNVESRMMLKGDIIRDNKLLYESTVLNDIVIHRGGDIFMSEFDVYVNEQLLGAYSADGIILSTPTGSTAYNLSAGGPIARPNSHMIILTPICPHTITSRSILLSRNDTIEVIIGESRIPKEENRKLTFDGDSVINVKSGDQIKIYEASQTTKIAKLDEGSFLQTVKDKLE